jgi:ABC-type multidrug transport system fused ATPase/permease subunit
MCVKGGYTIKTDPLPGGKRVHVPTIDRRRPHLTALFPPLCADPQRNPLTNVLSRLSPRVLSPFWIGEQGRDRSVRMTSYQDICHTDGVSKTYPRGKKRFENIHLNFLPRVKIGVVGVNGSGKSTLLEIRLSH